MVSLSYRRASSAFSAAFRARRSSRSVRPSGSAASVPSIWARVRPDPGLHLEAFATYDAMSVFLVALAAWCVIRAGARGPATGAMVAAAAILALANATAYASLLFDPLIAALALLTAPWTARGLLAFMSAALALGAARAGASAYQGFAESSRRPGRLVRRHRRRVGGRPVHRGRADGPRRELRSVIALVFPASLGITQSRAFSASWPNASAFIAIFGPLVGHSTGPLLVENPSVAEYPPAGAQWQRWSSTRNITLPAGTYTGGPAAASVTSPGNAPVYANYIAEGYFSLVALNFTDTTGLERQIAADLRRNHHYHIIQVVPYGIEVPPIGQGTYIIWQYQASTRQAGYTPDSEPGRRHT